METTKSKDQKGLFHIAAFFSAHPKPDGFRWPGFLHLTENSTGITGNSILKIYEATAKVILSLNR